MPHDLTIIIPQYGQPELTLNCLRSLRDCEQETWPVIVVDDGSPAEAVAKLRAGNLAGTTVLEQPHQGITAAWNRGAAHATTSMLLFLNNDVLFTGPTVSCLLDALNNALLAGIRLRTERAVPRKIRERLPLAQFLEGWCFAVRKTVWEQVGGFDESLALYFSDTDFQARVAQTEPEHPAPLAALPSLPVKHLGHRSTKRLPTRSLQWREDRARFCEKWSRSECRN